jgi:hypothetical protein
MAMRWRSRADGADRDRLAESLEGLITALVEHLGPEEDQVLPLASRCLTQAEWNQLGEEGQGALPKSRLPVVFGMVMKDADPEVIRGVLANVPVIPRLLLPRITEPRFAEALGDAAPPGRTRSPLLPGGGLTQRRYWFRRPRGGGCTGCRPVARLHGRVGSSRGGAELGRRPRQSRTAVACIDPQEPRLGRAGNGCSCCSGCRPRWRLSDLRRAAPAAVATRAGRLAWLGPSPRPGSVRGCAGGWTPRCWHCSTKGPTGHAFDEYRCAPRVRRLAGWLLATIRSCSDAVRAVTPVSELTGGRCRGGACRGRDTRLAVLTARWPGWRRSCRRRGRWWPARSPLCRVQGLRATAP